MTREPPAHVRKLTPPPEPVEIAAGWLQLRPWQPALGDQALVLFGDPELRRWWVTPPALGEDFIGYLLCMH